MKNKGMIVLLLFALIFIAGCNYTSKATASICDDACQQERDDYIQKVNSLLMQADEINAKSEEWKSVTNEDLEKMKLLKDKVLILDIPQDFDMVHDYYQRAFSHFAEAMEYFVKANEEYSIASDSPNIQIHNMATSKVIHNIQEANKLLIYADEEVKFATRLASQS